MDHPSNGVARPFAPDTFEFNASIFWTTLLAALEKHEVRYRTVRTRSSEVQSSSFAVHPSDKAKLGKVFSEVRRTGYRAVRSVKICPGRHRIVFAKSDAEAEIEAVELNFRAPAESAAMSTDDLTIHHRPSWFEALWQSLIGNRVRNGAFVVFLGPDGVGKTTLLTNVTAALAPVFEGQHFFRWRPAMFARAPRPNAPPHSKPRRSLKGSLSYLGFLWLDFVAGYLLRTRKMLRRGGLVVYDRYYHDVLVDPRRYRYDGPRRLAQLASRLVPPKQAFFVVLDADEQTIFSRKQQLALEDIRELRKLYRKFAQATPFSVVVNTDRPLEESTREVVSAVLRYLANQTESNNPAWFGCNEMLRVKEATAASLPGSELSN